MTLPSFWWHTVATEEEAASGLAAAKWCAIEASRTSRISTAEVKLTHK